MRKLLFVLLGVLTLGSLVSCGGGGGGGGSGGDKGGFTLAKTQVNFETLQGTQSILNESIALTVTGSKVVYVGAAFPENAVVPSWLGINITGSGKSYQLHIEVNPYTTVPGNYSATFQVGTADENGNILATKNVSVAFKYRAAVSFSAGSMTAEFVYGGQVDSEQFSLPFSADSATNWTASSDQNWLTLENSSGTGSGTLLATVNLAGLLPGEYVATVNLVDSSNPQNAATRTYTATIGAPELNVSTNNVVFGGELGTDFASEQVSLNLNTGNRSHPFSIGITYASGANWLGLSANAGQVDGTAAVINLTSNISSLLSGTYEARLDISVQVDALQLTYPISVVLKKEANRIVVSQNGVALMSAPSRSLLSRELVVLSNIDRDDVPWSASSDQAWLSVTASGETGDPIVVTASPDGLASGATYFGLVTINSTDTTVENSQTIRVGFTVLQDDPDPLITLLLSSETDSGADYVEDRPFIVASPVEPLIFTNVDNELRAYNVYTGTVERTFTDVVALQGGMAISGDGSSLFVFDRTNIEVVEIDAVNGSVTRRFSASGGGDIRNLMPAYIRPDGLPLLVGVGLNVYNLETGDSVQFASESYSPSGVSLLGANSQPDWVVTDKGALFKLDYSFLDGGKLVVTNVFSAYTASGAEGQACVNGEGTRVYTASGAPYNFPGTGIESRNVEQVLPGDAYPVAVVCGWNGVIVGGSDSYYDAEDIFVYNGATGDSLGNLSSSSYTSYRSLVKRGLAISGDASRLVAISENSNSANQLRFYTIPAL